MIFRSPSPRHLVIATVAAVMFSVAGCANTIANHGQPAHHDRITLNPMVQADGLGRAPIRSEAPRLSQHWRDEIPSTDEERPAAFPFVAFSNRSFQELLDAHSQTLLAATNDIEDATGIGPWRILEQSGMSCGPKDPTSEFNDTIGSSTTIRVTASAPVTDDQFFTVMEISEAHFPGVGNPANQVRLYDEPGHRVYRMVSNRDDSMQIAYKAAAGNIFIGFYSGCYLTNGS